MLVDFADSASEGIVLAVLRRGSLEPSEIELLRFVTCPGQVAILDEFDSAHQYKHFLDAYQMLATAPIGRKELSEIGRATPSGFLRRLLWKREFAKPVLTHAALSSVRCGYDLARAGLRWENCIRTKFRDVYKNEIQVYVLKPPEGDEPSVLFTIKRAPYPDDFWYLEEARLAKNDRPSAPQMERLNDLLEELGVSTRKPLFSILDELEESESGVSGLYEDPDIDDEAA
jgi:hypothetical protein